MTRFVTLSEAKGLARLRYFASLSMTELAQYDEICHPERSEGSYELPPWRRGEFAFGKIHKSSKKK